MDTIQLFINKSQVVVNKLKEEIKLIRSNRVNASLIENLFIETYGGTTKLKLLELATIVNEGPQNLIITPFDPSIIGDIEKEILKSPLGISPVIQGNKIVLKFPALTQEQREKLTKLVGQIVEEAKKEIRNLRDEARKRIKNHFEKKEITEDQKFRLEEEIDKNTRDFMEKINQIKENKEKEILEI